MQTYLRLSVVVFGLSVMSCGAEQFLVPLDDAGTPPPADADPIGDLPADLPSPDLPDETAPLAANGAACAAPDQCDSNFCVDGVCCDGACTGPCLSCALADSKGQCKPHQGGTDPEDDCMDEGQTSCGLNGQCDDGGKCQRYPVGTTCAPTSCTGMTLAVSGSCDAQGACHKPDPISCGKFQCASATACRTSCTTTDECVPPNVCFDGACGGLTGQYYNGVNLTTLVLTRVDPNVAFNWGAGSPGTGVPADPFSVRWTGTLTAKYSELYTFSIASNDGERLTLDNTVVINHFVDHTAAPADTGTFMMTAGHAYALKLEYYERASTAEIHLSWSSPSQLKEFIPASALSPGP